MLQGLQSLVWQKSHRKTRGRKARVSEEKVKRQEGYLYFIDKSGYVASQRFPPIAAIHNAIPMHPARLYKYDKLKIILVMAEFVIPADVVSDVAMELISFCKKNKINQIFSISGMAMKKPKDNIYLIGPQDMLKKAAR